MLSDLLIRLRALFQRNAVERELDDEMRFHFDQQVDKFVQSGLPLAEARRRARLIFGGSDQIKEECRDARGVHFLEVLWHDLHYGARMLCKNSGFTAVAVLTLALGIGANTAVFSVVNSVLLRPLAYRNPQQLYVIREIVPQWSKSYPLLAANLQDFLIWQKECHSFDQVALAESLDMTLRGAGETEQIHGVRGSANLFDVLGVHPALGRSFFSEEDQPGRDRVVILTDSFWHTRFHSDPALVGTAITLDGEAHVVVGILPAAFRFPKELGTLSRFGAHTAFFKPLGGAMFYEQGLISEFDFAAIARLKPGVSPEQAEADLNVVQAQIAKQANEKLDLRGKLLPLEAEVVGSSRRGLVLLLAAVGAVLLIVCVNLANLLLARIPGRMREAAIRTALGASRSRLLGQMLAESLLLAFLGGTLGVCLAGFAVSWIAHSLLVDLPRVNEVTIDTRVLSFAIALSTLTGTLFGMLPAWRIAHAAPQEILKSGGTASTESRRTGDLRKTLVGFEVALCTLLLLLAGLLTDSLIHLVRVNTGFSVEHVLTADVSLPPPSYSAPAARERFYNQVLANIRALPGVRSAGWVSILPLEGEGGVSDISLPGEQIRPEQKPFANHRAVSPGYFETMGIPLLQGRLFTEGDRGRKLIVVSQSVAERLWPGKNPVGQECIAGWGELQRSQVIGVVGDIRTVRLDSPPLLMVYTPQSYAEVPPSAPASASIVVRTDIDPSTLASAVRGVVRSVGEDVPVIALRPMKQVVSESLSTRRFQMLLSVSFALCALFLAALGIFGVVAYSVEQRRQELGIRMALGAQSKDLLRLILRQGMAPVLLGFASGALAAFLAGRLIESFLFMVTASDPLAMVCVALTVGLAALAACYFPARRTMRVDPMVALRYE